MREARPIQTDNTFDALALIEEEEVEDVEVSAHRVEVREDAHPSSPHADRPKRRDTKQRKQQTLLTNQMRRQTHEPQIQYIDYPRKDQATTSSAPTATTSLKVATYLANRPEKEQVLMDTGAEVSLLPLRYCQKWVCV